MTEPTRKDVEWLRKVIKAEKEDRRQKKAKKIEALNKDFDNSCAQFKTILVIVCLLSWVVYACLGHLPPAIASTGILSFVILTEWCVDSGIKF
jgi:hypothetical protein